MGAILLTWSPECAFRCLPDIIRLGSHAPHQNENRNSVGPSHAPPQAYASSRHDADRKLPFRGGNQLLASQGYVHMRGPAAEELFTTVEPVLDGAQPCVLSGSDLCPTFAPSHFARHMCSGGQDHMLSTYTALRGACHPQPSPGMHSDRSLKGLVAALCTCMG